MIRRENYDSYDTGSKPPEILEKLPMEIREMIWKYCMPTADSVGNTIHMFRPSLWTNGDLTRPRFLPKICYILTVTREETIGAFVRSCVFCTMGNKDIANLLAFAGSFDGGLSHIRASHLIMFGNYKLRKSPHDPKLKNEDLEFAIACRGLRTVRLWFDRDHLKTPVKPEGVLYWIHKPLPVEEFVEYYHLRRLFDCEKLRLVYLDREPRGTGAVDGLQDLAEWIQAEFARPNQTFYCQVTWAW